MKTKLAIAALALALPFAASADVSYKYLDVNYQFAGDIDVDLGPLGSGSVDTDGFGIRSSFEIDETWFATFEYTSLATDPSGLDITDWALHGGWRNDMFFAKFGYETMELDAGGGNSADDGGYNLDFGVRTMVSDSVELNGHLGYSDLGDLDTFMNYGFGAVWMFGEQMGASFNYDMRSADGADFTTMGVGLRVNF